MSTFSDRFPGNEMSPQQPRGFWGNVGLIRPVAWVVAFALFFGMMALFWLVIWPSQGADEAARTPYAVKVCVPLIIASFLFVYVLLVGYVHVDAKRRGMRYVMWTLLAIFIGNFIGIILYFLMRDPMPTPCPKCGKMSAASFTFCPHCGSELMRTCRVCHKKLGVGWANCAYCGTPVTGQTGSSAPPAVV